MRALEKGLKFKLKVVMEAICLQRCELAGG